MSARPDGRPTPTEMIAGRSTRMGGRAIASPVAAGGLRNLSQSGRNPEVTGDRTGGRLAAPQRAVDAAVLGDLAGEIEPRVSIPER